MVLAFAEAANHEVGPLNSIKYGLSAKDAMKYLRTRNVVGTTGGISPDPYLDEVASSGETAFDAFVKNERRIETCFEGMRFYDLRRWNTSLSDLNKPVHGVTIVKNDDNSFRYTSVEVENRSFTSPFLPIPYAEMLRMNSLVQNEGWDAGNNTLKKEMMKKIVVFLFLVAALSSCYDDYIKDFDSDGVYFPVSA